MTLNEAYELLRKEVLSLRRENKKLKNGTYLDADRISHEKEIRRLSRELEASKKAADRFERLWHEAQCSALFSGDLDLERKVGDLEAEIAALSAKLQEAHAMIEQLRLQLEEANGNITKLKAQMNRDHENSSIPSSGKPFHKKISNSRTVSGRKPGAQSGHPGHKRPVLEPTEPVVYIPVPPSILNDPELRPTGKFISKQLIDIDIRVSVTEYRTPEYRNIHTGSRVHAAFPDGLANDCTYGSNVKALAFILNNYCNVSIDKTREFIEGISGSRITLSKGMIASLPKKFSIATEEDRKHIYSMLLLAPSMHSDFTSGRVNGKNVQINICANEYEMLYSFKEHKGHEGIKGTPAEEYQQTLIHDHDKTFYSYGSSHQECLAHVLRYLQDSIDNEAHLTWNSSMKAFLSSMIHETKNNRELSEEQIISYERTYDDILDTGQKEYTDHPPNKYYPDGYNLLKRMTEYRDSHLYFLRHPDVDYTNNIAERGLRKYKRKQSQAVTFRSNKSVDYLCNCMSIIETGKLQGRTAYDSARSAFGLS